MKIWRLLLRLVVGVLFVGHGTQKPFGWFGGHGLEGRSQFFERIGLRPGKPNVIADGVGEAGGGALLAAGLLTPLGTAGTAGSMLVAMRCVRLENELAAGPASEPSEPEALRQ